MRIRIFSFLILIFLISCKKSEVRVNKFIGTWHDTEYIVPGKSSIRINTDSSFYYKSRGCQGGSVSNGKWKIIGDSIELNSTTSDSCYKMFPFILCIPFRENIKKDVRTIPNCNPDNDTFFAIFSKEVFYMKNDSLIYKLKKNSKCPDTLKIVFAKTQKIRK
ncbi:hypothetical protein ASF10_23020 [Flavobacterium sp. Leaf82]|jgi:hypothetical protein|uniref:hypothetical protein n=1 Tax=unclassified Flavobacterium TaxID=196869 RepID=UPI000701F11F|nr:hypothetical protein [Flavobacterium sp. Leaf82]KQO28405.1 hypothetical protein ASF10_23020 [Flavobacterium sp. Leaf82]